MQYLQSFLASSGGYDQLEARPGFENPTFRQEYMQNRTDRVNPIAIYSCLPFAFETTLIPMAMNNSELSRRVNKNMISWLIDVYNGVPRGTLARRHPSTTEEEYYRSASKLTILLVRYSRYLREREVYSPSELLQLSIMLQKYTRFCNADSLIKAIESPQKDDQTLHILLTIFKKPLNWIQEKFNREGLLDAIHKVSVRTGQVREPLAWLYVIKQGFSYYDMPFTMSEFITFTEWNQSALRFYSQGIYAVLTQQHVNQLIQLNESRQIEAIKRFVKLSLFYPYYIEEQHVQQFISLIRIKRLRYGKTLNWKDQDGSHKIGVVYRGTLSIEYQWKRNIQIAQLTKGKFITNHYIKDQLEEIQDFQLERVEPKSNKAQQFPKYKYVSKSDDTLLLIFNLRLIKQSPYNVNPDLLPIIKNSFEKYTEKLKSSIELTEENKLYRNKSSIKQKIKKQEAKQTVKRNVSLHISNNTIVSSPFLKTFATIELEQSPFETVRTIDLPQPNKQFSKAVFASISPKSTRLRTERAKTIQVDRPRTNYRLIHNTWVEEMSKKKIQSKSFSTLQTLTTQNPQKQKQIQQFNEEKQRQTKPQFFVPDQFVKRKLRLKYQGLVKKVRDMDFTIKRNHEESIAEKMMRLEQHIDSKRIVRLNNAKKKFKLLRDKVQY